MSRNVNTVILCEDRQQETFARRFLIQTGLHPRCIRPIIAPKGRGAGEQFVRANFVQELLYFRRRSARMKQALVVVIDADTTSVEERIRQLDAAAQQAGCDPRRSDERVAIFVPARNIETWLAYLAGGDVNESQTYPRLDRPRDCQSQVASLHGYCQSQRLRDPAPPSLAAACREYQLRLTSD